MNQGYDAAQKIQQEDDLDRWRFASEIAQVIRDTPKEWSARIGIFGKWGEGKSTVLHFIQALLEPEGNIIVPFNPWAAQDLNDLWSSFGVALLQSLSAKNLTAESYIKAQARRAQEKLKSSGLVDVGKAAAGLLGREGAYSSVMSAVGNWLRPDGEQLNKIRETLGDKRVIVFVDDLDRAKPELLPTLFLSLREILDLPGFTFVLAFDSEIVAKGLVTANQAWGDGESFLDKILDFQYHLPPVTEESKRILLNKALDSYAKFVPKDSTNSIEHLLPDNPRKLKALIRGLISLKSEVKRYDPDELIWTDIWLAVLIRQESYQLFDRLLEANTLDTEIGVGYRLLKSNPKLREKKDEDSDETTKLFTEVGITDERKIARLLVLVSAARTLGSLQLRQNWLLTISQKSVTGREFRALLAKWRSDQRGAVITKWIEKHSSETLIKRSDVEESLLQWMLLFKQNETSAAAQAMTVEENNVHCLEASLILTMTQQMLSEVPSLLTIAHFEMLYGAMTQWVAFVKNKADVALRMHEKKVFVSLLKCIPGYEAPAMLGVLRKDEYSTLGMDDVTRGRKHFRDECIEILIPKVESEFVKSLRQPESIRRLSNGDIFSGFNFILFSKDRLPWKGPVRDALFKLAHDGARNYIDHEKVMDFINLLVLAEQNRSQSVQRASAIEIAKDAEFVKAIWKAAISMPIQFRMLQKVADMRDALIHLGADESDLPLTPELKERVNAISSER